MFALKKLFLLHMPAFAALRLASTADGSPHGHPQALTVRGLSSAEFCQPIGYGSNSVPSGTTCASFEGENMKVVFNAETGWKITDVHVWVGGQPPGSSVPTAPGQLPYTLAKGSCTINSDTKATCTFPIQSTWRACGVPLYVISHVSATTPALVSEIGWGTGPCYELKTKGNCAKYWSFTTKCECPVVIDYEPVYATVGLEILEKTRPEYHANDLQKTYTTTIKTTTVYTYDYPDKPTVTPCNDPWPAKATPTIKETTVFPSDYVFPAPTFMCS